MERTTRHAAEPWNENELNRILMAARTMPGLVGDIPGRNYWPALLLLTLDVGIPASKAIQLPSTALNKSTGGLSFQYLIHQLHAMTFEALNALPRNTEKLLPWRSSTGDRSAKSLELQSREILCRASVGDSASDLFSRIRVTGCHRPELLDRIQPLLESGPRDGKTTTIEPWSLPELNRLLMSARTMDEPVGEVLGKDFWPALLLLILDLDITAEVAVQLPANVVEFGHIQLPDTSRLTALHPRTIEALQSLPPGREKLIPWPKDSGRPPYQMLYRDYKTVLYRAGFPFTPKNSFTRLQATRRKMPGVLDFVQSVPGFRPHAGKPQLVRARDRRQHALARNDGINVQEASGPSHKDVASKVTEGKTNAIVPARDVELSDNPATLLNVFRSKYRNTRLRQASKGTVYDYERSLRLLYSFAGKELTFAELTDELLEDFLSNCLERGVSAATCNKYRASLLALWRFGWRKRLTNEQPRDVSKLKVDETSVDAWTTAELQRIVEAASKLTGTVCEIPAGIWWPAFILTLYDTGLRFTALIRRPTSDLNMQTGWLTVDAKDQKQRKAQAFKLHNDTLSFIQQMQPLDRKFLFPWRAVCGHVIRDEYRMILQSAGLPCSKRDLFHKLRRTSATSLAAATDERTACAHLGHSSVTVTRRYIDPKQLQRLAASELIARPDVPSSLKGEPV